MSKVTKDMPLADLAALVCQNLKNHGIEAVLTGGSVVSIYSNNEYESKDLDFIATARQQALTAAMAAIGFSVKNRYFVHPETEYFVEFPPPPLAIGNEPVTTLATEIRETGVLLMLTPTQCVMDRLAAFYYWDDRSAFQQALAVSRHQEIDWQAVKAWSQRERHIKKYQEFLRSAKSRKKSTRSTR